MTSLTTWSVPCVISGINTSGIIIPEKPYLLWIPYRNRHPVMQEMWRLYAGRRVGGGSSGYVPLSASAEELYDVENDRYELNNLADDVGHHEVLERMRGSLTQCSLNSGYGGYIREQMVAQWYPDGTQPQTATPILFRLTPNTPAGR